MRSLANWLLILILSALLNVLAIPVIAQNNIILKGDTLIVNKQAKFWINEEITFGKGTMPDKSFSYIYEAPNSLSKLINYSRKKKLLSPVYTGYKAKIVKFEKAIGHNKKDYNYNVIVLEIASGKRYWCDFSNAFKYNEILLKENAIPADSQLNTISDNKDKDEQLKDLKQLLDDGQISQHEYDIRKKKLLDSQKKVSAKSKNSKPVTAF